MQTYSQPNITLILVCALGLPGNLLVIAVYVAKMTTSIRVYLFALAVADTAICVCGIALAASLTNFELKIIVFLIMSFAVNFSVGLLTFVSVERLLAVLRPHSFTLNPRRAKMALLIITVYVTITTIVQVFLVAFTGNGRFHAIAQFCFVFPCTSTMLICYTIMAYKLLKKARRNVCVHNVVHLVEPGISKVNSTTGDGTRRCNPGPSIVTTEIIKYHMSGEIKSSQPATTNMSEKQVQTVKNLILLFVITVIFIICWLPSWLRTLGLTIHDDVIRLLILNSVINPFIYGVASAMFREDVRRFYSKIRDKLTAC